MRQAHPAEYNRDLEDRYEVPGGRDEWTSEDMLEMARRELAYNGPFVNKHLLGFYPERNLDFIKNRRREAKYKEVIQRLAGENAGPSSDAVEVFQRMSEAVAALIQSPADAAGTSEASVVVESSAELHSSGSLNPNASDFHPLRQSHKIVLFLRDYWAAQGGWVDADEAVYNMTQLVDTHNQRERVREQLAIYLKALLPQMSDRLGGHSNNNRRERTRPVEALNRRQERAFLYKTVQKMYRTNRASLARNIIDDSPVGGSQTFPNVQSAESKFRQIFSHPSKRDIEDIKDKQETQDLSSPISENEIVWALGANKSPSAGVDGVKIKDLMKVPLKKLVLLFNSMLLFGVAPSALKRNRTILIPKGGDSDDINNWRPITIASVVTRVLHRILGKRMGGIQIHPNQRGFRQVDGVLLNNLTLQALIKERRKSLKPYTILSVDVRKAFDTVSQQSIVRAMKRLGIDETTVRYVEDSFEDATTVVQLGRGMTGEIPICRGVKQGDPLSPYLFNFVLDELICDLQGAEGGLPVNDTARLAVLGYADDLLLLANSPKEATKRLKLAADFFARRGMGFNPSKCTAMTVQVNRANKHSYCITRPLFYIEGQAIRQLQPGEMFGYLGANYGVMGRSKPVLDEVNIQLRRIGKSPLKPQQKLAILKVYLLPRYLHLLQSPVVTKKTLKYFDRVVRVAVRSYLHLNKTCAEAFIHAPVREGGLGVSCFSEIIPAILRNRLNRLFIAADPITSATLSTSYSVEFVRKLGRWTGESGGSMRALAQRMSERLDTGFSGNGLRQGRAYPRCSDWVPNPPPYWSGADFVRAVQLRGNLLPVRGVPSNPPGERQCRMGCLRTESLSHVLQKCPVSLRTRIRRHDHLVQTVRKIAERKGWTVEVEPRIRCTDGALKIPDLLLRMGSRIVVVDATVSWEGPNPLSVAALNKVAIYSEPRLIQALNVRHPGAIIVVAPLVVGARGTWCVENSTLSSVLGFSHQDMKTLVTQTIIGSIMVWKDFMKSSRAVRCP